MCAVTGEQHLAYEMRVLPLELLAPTGKRYSREQRPTKTLALAAPDRYPWLEQKTTVRRPIVNVERSVPAPNRSDSICIR